MVSRRENMKRYIKLITKQLPNFITKYPTEDQIFLNQFIEPLQYNDEADFKRNKLAQRYQFARKFFTEHELYLSNPFFWFVDSYFENVEISLRVSDFHADFFYDYLLSILRGTTGQYDGVFQLLKDNIALSDLRWEELQYTSAKIHIPLQSQELDIIKSVYELLKTHPLQILKPRRLRSVLLNQHEFPRLSSRLPKLFTLLNAKWTVWPQYSAFGIESFVMYLKINRKSTLLDILDFQREKQSIISTSTVYSIRQTENEYTGFLHLPHGSENLLISHLEKKRKNGELQDFSISKIIENHWTYSLAQYQVESGWKELNKSAWSGLVHLIRLKTLPRRRKHIEFEYITPRREKEWTYRNLEDPLLAIELVCKKNIFDYSDLLTETYTSKEFEILKELISKHSIFVDFFPYRLCAEYSLDLYLIKAPKISLYQLKRLLELLPTARIAMTVDNSYIFTYLTNVMAQKIHSDLGWQLFPLLPAHNAAKRTLDMFDNESIQWRLPKILVD